MPRVVCSAAMPIDIRPILGDDATIVAPDRGSFSRAELIENVQGADALITLLDVEVDSELLDAAGAPRVVANFAVGTDNVDVSAATKRGCVVSNTPDVLTEATADFTFALLLGVARRLLEGDALARSGCWEGWQPDLLLGAPVGGATLGIVGLGRIGQAVAARARGFSMNVLYHGRQDQPAAEALGATRKSLPELAAEADFVTLHCPLTPETKELVNAEMLQQMKSTAILINTARGGCVDEVALADALSTGIIGGAGLDVFVDEPQISRGLREAPNVLLAPHAGSATTVARAQMATICAEAVRDALAGVRPKTTINSEAWKR